MAQRNPLTFPDFLLTLFILRLHQLEEPRHDRLANMINRKADMRTEKRVFWEKRLGIGIC